MNNQVIEKVPPDYYQKSIDQNIIQRWWHMNRLHVADYFLKKYNNSEKKIRLLDVGCASGWFLSEICKKNRFINAIGIDVHKNAVEYAKKKYPNIQFFTGDAHKLAFKSKSFDCIMCMNVLEHLENPIKALQEMKRVVKNDGFIIIGMDSENMLFSIAWYVWLKMKGRVWQSAHLHKFRAHNLRNIFIESHLTIKEEKTFNLTMALMYVLKKAR